LCACLLGASVARGAEADDLLARTDAAIANMAQKVWVINMRIIAGDGDVREAKMLMLQGGTDKRMLRFLAPAPMRNTALLTIGAHDFYVFLPQEGRTRRLGSSAMNQTFMGSDFSFEDLGSVYLGGLYSPRIVGKSGEETILELTPKGESTWSRLRVYADSHALARRIEYFDKAGKHVRTRTATWKQGESRFESWFPQRLLMVNELTKHATELVVQVADADRTIPSDVFTLRGLQRGDDLHFAP
jgi:hypothetical protein